MSTKTPKYATVYRQVGKYTTHRATAEAIYDHLLACPKDLPDGARINNLVFRFPAYRAACVQFTFHDKYDLRVSPAATSEVQVERGWTANYEGPYGRGEVIDHPKSPWPTRSRVQDLHRIRLAVLRTIRYHAKEAARVEAQIERSRTRQNDGPGVRLVPAN